MKMKLIFWITAMLSTIPVALAQTGLFSGEGGASFAGFGIVAVIIFFVVKEIINQFRRKK